MGPDKGQSEPGWMVSMTGSRLLSAPLSPSLLPELMLSTESQSGPGVKPQGVWSKTSPFQAKFIAFSMPWSDFSPSSSWSSSCWFGGLLPSGWGTLPYCVRKATLLILPTLTRFPVETGAHTLDGQTASRQGSHSKEISSSPSILSATLLRTL